MHFTWLRQINTFFNCRPIVAREKRPFSRVYPHSLKPLLAAHWKSLSFWSNCFLCLICSSHTDFRLCLKNRSLTKKFNI